MPEISTLKWIVEFSNAHPLPSTLLIAMLIDVATGVAAAIAMKTLSSKISYAGMMKKVIVLLVVALAGAIERLKPEFPVMASTCLMFVFTEGLSIIENAGRAGVPIPAKLREVIEVLGSSNKPTTPSRDTVHIDKMNVSSPTVSAHVAEIPPIGTRTTTHTTVDTKQS